MKTSRIMLTVIAALAVAMLAACSSQAHTSSTASAGSAGSAAVESDASQSQESADSSSSSASASSTGANAIGTVANTIAQDEDALVSSYPDKFEQVEYADSETGLSVTYNLFLPAGYDASKSYPLVVFIADSSCAKGDASRSLTQGLGALVWASDEWQAANECIVCVPTYPETILDDRDGYTTTEYVELTKRLIDSVSSEYAVDTNRIYGTGQSMGCMTTLILASEYPDLYAACMFVDGQWDVSTLSNLESQKFVYFAAEDDAPASAGMSEVMGMFQADNVPFASAQWDGAWTPDELSSAANDLFANGSDANFVLWTSGSIEANSGMGGGAGGGMGGAGVHMASFDYAYNCIAVMEWLFQQVR